jgi:hypothetical protein
MKGTNMPTKPVIMFDVRTPQLAVQWPNKYTGQINLHSAVKLDDHNNLHKIAKSVGAKCIELRPDGLYVYPYHK